MNNKIKIINVVGARPNFMKIAPIMYEMKECERIQPALVHTGQHYDKNMSKLFFEDLEIPKPDVDLEVGSGSHAVQTAEIMKRFEPVLIREKPDYILVVGDVNSTIACSLTASKLGIKTIHVEAGLRSYDRTMPEEINRVLTDSISDLLFTTEKDAENNLLREGIDKEKIFFVGNAMIDTLLKNVQKSKKSKILEALSLSIRNPQSAIKNSVAPYAVLTLHRPSNVDNMQNLKNILEALSVLAKEQPVIFPVHPRTRKNIISYGLDKSFNITDKNNASSHLITKGIKLIDPLGYLDFMNLMANAKLVMTDSGGMQEETTVLQIPCLTLRENTERPITVTEGTNIMVGNDKDKIIKEGLDILNGKVKKGRIPEFWDGKASERIVNIIVSQHSAKKINKKR